MVIDFEWFERSRLGYCRIPEMKTLMITRISISSDEHAEDHVSGWTQSEIVNENVKQKINLIADEDRIEKIFSGPELIWWCCDVLVAVACVCVCVRAGGRECMWRMCDIRKEAERAVRWCEGAVRPQRTNKTKAPPPTPAQLRAPNKESEPRRDRLKCRSGWSGFRRKEDYMMFELLVLPLSELKIILIMSRWFVFHQIKVSGHVIWTLDGQKMNDNSIERPSPNAQWRKSKNRKWFVVRATPWKMIDWLWTKCYRLNERVSQRNLSCFSNCHEWTRTLWW